MSSSRKSKVATKIARQIPSIRHLQTTRNSSRLPRTFKNGREFDVHAFLATIGEGRKIVPVAKKQTIYAQGAACDAVFYIQTGQVKLTVISTQGKEAIVALLEPGAFFGEGCLAGQLVCMAAATAADRAV